MCQSVAVIKRGQCGGKYVGNVQQLADLLEVNPWDLAWSDDEDGNPVVAEPIEGDYKYCLCPIDLEATAKKFHYAFEWDDSGDGVMVMTDKYFLDGKDAKPWPDGDKDLLGWAKWFEQQDRRVAQEQIGDSKISTVFLGMDHNFGGGPPLLFETMVFGGKHDGHQERCTTWQQAEQQHQLVCDVVEHAQKEKANG